MRFLNKSALLLPLLILLIGVSHVTAQNGTTKITGIWGDGPVNSVHIIDNQNVLFNYGTYLRTADFSNPESPEITRELLTQISGINEVYFHDDYFFATNSWHRDRYMYYYKEGNRPFDNFSGVVTGQQLRIHGDIGFAFSQRDFFVLNTSDLDDRIVWRTNLSIVDRPRTVRAYDIVGDKAYIASNQNLHVVDFSDPDNAVEISNAPIEMGISSNKIRVIDDHLFLASFASAGIFDISDPANPQQVAIIDDFQGQGISTLDVSGNLLFLLANSTIVSGPGELTIYDISDLENPLLVETIAPGVELFDFDVLDDAIYIAAGASGLLHYQLKEDNTAEWVSTIGATGNLETMLQIEDIAYVLTQDSVLHTVDVSDYQAPVTLGSVRVNGLTDLTPFDEQTLILTSQTGFELIDISDPASPEVLSVYTFEEDDMNHVRAAARGDFVFLANTDVRRQTRIEAVNVSDVSNPVLSSTFTETAFSSAPLFPVIYGDYLFAVERAFGGSLEIYDISNPEEVTFARSRNIPSLANAQIYNQYLVGTSGSNLLFFDVSDINSISQTASFSASQDLNGLKIMGDMAFTAAIGFFSSNTSLYTLDLSNLDEITPLSVFSFDAWWPEIIFLADGAELFGGNEDMALLGSSIGPGFYIYDTFLPEPTHISDTGQQLPESVILKPNYPNPFNPTTSIRFYLPEQSDISLSLYNAVGQKVAEIANGHFSAGSHNISFDGSHLSSGIYLYRLQTPNQAITRKMTLMK